ncbi:transcription elongation factor GreA [Candidatus Magnetominusculus xianensis]|uniref:Transcription elongation factor GreA n=1 Tax=Candidatus Magnetominusculus xianensis TaxID=1748249 RepID=A0ABR5SJS2_9BACT|nr:transcription elongation factor GreA [Candidatus Magnetominusculus xianensis]KWT92756.1 transcription elongation factor GreA [Candidatus Magnetominusculus xianensis]MBF0405210.1 transcription elongation factor GreA [Nitrospirota bacterium]
MERVPMTPDGFKKITEELDRLLKEERPQNIKDIATARAHGDLSENAEYAAAREKQSFLEGRIKELQSKVAMAQVIDPSKIKGDKISFGAKVKLFDLDTDEEKIFFLVGPDEADVKTGKISVTSPVGKALLGKVVGDEAIIKAPARTFSYEVLDIIFE